MKLSQVKPCVRYLVKNVIAFKMENSNPILHKATEALKAAMANENSTDEDINDAHEFFDMVSDDWLTASNNIDEVTEILFNQFASIEDGTTKLKHEKLFKALNALPTHEDKHLLILAIKHHGLFKRGLFKQWRNENNIEDVTLSDLAERQPVYKAPSKVSLRAHLQKKEELTMNKLYEISMLLKERLGRRK